MIENKLSIVDLRHLYFSYPDLSVLRDASFQVFPNEFVGIIGPNGGGKTTLLKLILGFLTPDSGSIRIFNKTPIEARSRIAYVPQNTRFDKQFPISVLDVVLMGRLAHLPWYGTFCQKDKNAAYEALEKIGLVHLAERSYGTLSGGQAQRVLIARALVSNPELLILDEPTASVDSQTQTEIYKLLKVLSNQMTILMVTHDLNTSINVVEKIICVQQTVMTLKPAEVCEHFALGLYHPPLVNKKIPIVP